MQFTTVFTLLAAAMTASAMPSKNQNGAVIRRTGSGDGNVIGDNNNYCPSDTQEVCCNGSGIGLSCLVNLLGSPCADKTYCCSDEVVQGGLVNVNANCIGVL